jgi:TolA-binding protein
LPSDYDKAKEWFDILERDNKNATALCRVGQFYAERHAFHISNDFYGDALKTTAAKEDDGLREDLFLAIALNQFRDGSLADARKRLDQCIRTFPDGHRQDEALAALIAVQLKQGKRGDAQKNLQELQRRFPNSQAAATAAALVTRAQQ